MTIQVTKWSPDTCNCIIEYQWDDSLSSGAMVITPLNIINKCNIHTNEPTINDLWTSLTEENPRKNKAFKIILDNAPSNMIDIYQDGVIQLKKDITVSWSWSGTRDPYRTLTLSVIGYSLTNNQKNAIQNKIDQLLPNQNVIIVN